MRGLVRLLRHEHNVGDQVDVKVPRDNLVMTTEVTLGLFGER